MFATNVRRLLPALSSVRLDSTLGKAYVLGSMGLLCLLILATLCGLTARAEDWTTTDGTKYEDVKVLKYDALTVTILDADGGASVPLEKLPGDLQRKFEYDPAKAKAAMAALERNAALDKKADAPSKPTVTLIGTIIDSRSNGYYVEVSSPRDAGKPVTHSETHHGMGAIASADRSRGQAANVVGAGVYFLETKNFYLPGEHLGLVVYPCGPFDDFPWGPITIFTNDPNIVPVGPATKFAVVPPIPNQVIFRPGVKNDSFNPGSMKDDTIDNSATAAPAGTGGFNPGSMQSDAVQ